MESPLQKLIYQSQIKFVNKYNQSFVYLYFTKCVLDAGPGTVKMIGISLTVRVYDSVVNTGMK